MFNYIGGKHKHVSWLDPLFPNSNLDTYVEVFGGAGWVGVKSDRVLQSTTHIYNDFNPFIANIHECFRSKHQELLAQLELFPKSDRELYESFQQEIFGLNPPVVTLGDVVLAAKYLYMQTQIFSGVTLGIDSPIYFQDVASDGKYGSKYEAIKNKLRNNKIIERLEHITCVENMDCIDLIKKYDSPTTFFYVDPPYFNKEFLYTHEFPADKHIELANTLKNAQGRWCLSYYNFEELEQWYPRDQFYWHEQDVFRWSSTRSSKKEDFKKSSRGTEIAIMNYTPPENKNLTKENFDKLFEVES